MININVITKIIQTDKSVIFPLSQVSEKFKSVCEDYKKYIVEEERQDLIFLQKLKEYPNLKGALLRYQERITKADLIYCAKYVLDKLLVPCITAPERSSSMVSPKTMQVQFSLTVQMIDNMFNEDSEYYNDNTAIIYDILLQACEYGSIKILSHFIDSNIIDESVIRHKNNLLARKSRKKSLFYLMNKFNLSISELNVAGALFRNLVSSSDLETLQMLFSDETTNKYFTIDIFKITPIVSELKYIEDRISQKLEVSTYKSCKWFTNLCEKYFVRPKLEVIQLLFDNFGLKIFYDIDALEIIVLRNQLGKFPKENEEFQKWLYNRLIQSS